jgi:hypothetical protein
LDSKKQLIYTIKVLKRYNATTKIVFIVLKKVPYLTLCAHGNSAINTQKDLSIFHFFELLYLRFSILLNSDISRNSQYILFEHVIIATV